MRRGAGAALVICLLVGHWALAAKESKDPERRARELYELGLRHYNLGEYEPAIEAFKSAYLLSQASGLLLNIAQAQRLAGHCSQAALFYRNYLRAEPDSPHRAEVAAFI